MRITVAHVGTLFSRNLTPDPDTGLGDWSADDLRRALRDGRSRDGRVLSALDMPWTLLAGLEDADIDAIHAYLQSLPPVRNLVPAPEALGVWDGIVRKARALATGDPVRAGFHPGNAGRVPAEGAHLQPVRDPLADQAVAVTALVALAAYLVLRRRRTWLETIATGALLLAVPLIYAWPPLRWLPAAVVKGEPPFEGLDGWLGLPPIRRPPAPAEPDDPDADTFWFAYSGAYRR